MKKAKAYLLLHGIILLYSLGGLCSKKASAQEFLSTEFCLFYFLLIVILGVYAVLWQQILKRLPLSTAFANKSATVIWGMLWGALLFDETITLKMIIGAAFVLTGIVFIAADEGRENE